MWRMGWLKVAAIAVGILIAFLVVGSVIGFVIHAVTTLVIVALVAGAVAVAIKMARSGKQVSGKRAEREVREPESYEPLPRADVAPYSAPAPPRQSAPNTQDVDEELARLKREMGA
jgi:hypothetical protein